MTIKHKHYIFVFVFSFLFILFGTTTVFAEEKIEPPPITDVCFKGKIDCTQENKEISELEYPSLKEKVVKNAPYTISPRYASAYFSWSYSGSNADAQIYNSNSFGNWGIMTSYTRLSTNNANNTSVYRIYVHDYTTSNPYYVYYPSGTRFQMWVNGNFVKDQYANTDLRIYGTGYYLWYSVDVTLTNGVANKIETYSTDSQGASRQTRYFTPPASQYSVTFVNGLGTTLKTQTVARGNSATPPATPQRNGYTFAGWSGSYSNVTSDRTITATWYPNTYYVYYNPNGGTNAPPTTAFTFNSSARISSTIPTRPGYTFVGWQTTDSGTLTYYSPGQVIPNGWGSFTLTARWTVSNYTNTIYHWAWGFKNGEGNNDVKTAFNFTNTNFNANYGAVYSMNAGLGVSIPNGFKLRNSFGTSSISGSWAGYTMPRNVSQIAGNMYFEYNYDPISYSITYDLDGGTNAKANPSNYNVLYGLSLSSPTKEGYIFDGWYLNNKKVTGINEGQNARFSSGQDMYNKLNARTTGDLILKAKWLHQPKLIVFDRLFLVQESFDIETIKQALVAYDEYENTINENIQITGFENVKVGEVGTYKLEASIKTAMGNIVQKPFAINIVDELPDRELRFIDKEALESVNSQSIWKDHLQELEELLLVNTAIDKITAENN